MPDFDVFSLLEILKRKSHGKGKKEMTNAKDVLHKNITLPLSTSRLREHGRHARLPFLSSLPILVLHILDIEANRF